MPDYDDMNALLDEIDATCGPVGEPAAAAETEIETLMAAVDRLATAAEAPAASGGATGHEQVVDTEIRHAPPEDGERGEEDIDAAEAHWLPEATIAPPPGPETSAEEAAVAPPPDPETSAEETAVAPADALDPAGPGAAPHDGSPSRSRSRAQGPSTLSEIDGSLAEDAEDLLNANFDTVSDVLDEVFDEHAAIVQEPLGDVAIASAESDAQLTSSPTDEAAAGDSETEADAPAEEPAIEEQTVDAIASQALPDRESASALLPDRAPPETPPLEETAPADVAPAVLEEHEHEMLPESAPPPTAPASVTEIEPDPLDADDEPVEASESLWSKIEPALIAVLSIVNAPLRLLPQRLRPYVDWIALSLVFWVPIVWVVALFVVGN